MRETSVGALESSSKPTTWRIW